MSTPTLTPISTTPIDIDGGTVGCQQQVGTLVTLATSATDPDSIGLVLKWYLSINGLAESLLHTDSTPLAGIRSITYQLPSVYNTDQFRFRAAVSAAAGGPDKASVFIIVTMSTAVVIIPPSPPPPPLPPVTPPAPLPPYVYPPAQSFIDRKVILPPYLDEIDAWSQLADAITEVFGNRIDDPISFLQRLRELWITSPNVQTKIENYELLSQTDFLTYERQILIKQASMLGFSFKETDLLSDVDYTHIGRNIALYWYSKGKPDFIDFLSFVLNNELQVDSLWSTQTGVNKDQYGPFLPEGDAGIGIPVWQPGGTWFPTTHVQITLDITKFQAASIPKIVALFYAIANYNLVIENITLLGSLFIHSFDEPELARIVVAYPMYDVEWVIDSV